MITDPILRERIEQERNLPGVPTEEQVNMRDTVPQRSDRIGTKVEDLAGTGEIDASGG